MVIKMGFDDLRKQRIETLKIWITQRLEGYENITYDDALIFAMAEWGLSKGKAQEILDFAILTGNFYVGKEKRIKFKVVGK